MDPILYWNDVALEANRVSHTDPKDKGTLGPVLSARALAIVHLAMYDAWAGARGNPPALPPYLKSLPKPAPGASPDAAVAAAAHATLSALHGSQKPFLDRKLAEAPLTGSGLDDGRAFGLQVAKAILADRKDDPGAGEEGYTPALGRGAHRVDPDNPDQGFYAPFFGARSSGFAVTYRYELSSPPALGTGKYREALRQVRGKGAAPELLGALPGGLVRRTADETLIGLFWGYDGAAGLGTPPRLYNQIVRQVAMAKNIGTDATDLNARLFALVNAAMADAGILAWEQKYFHDFWRPVVGIREDDPSMGPTGQRNSSTSNQLSDDCDPAWLPLGAPATNSVGKKNFTPNFPAYPSGHATFGAAALGITRLFYGFDGPGPDDLFNNLSFMSEEFNGANRDNRGTVRPRHVRSFPDGLWQMIVENGRSRVFLGVHWIFDAFATDAQGEPDLGQEVGGVWLGLAIAKDIFNGGKEKGLLWDKKIKPR